MDQILPVKGVGRVNDYQEKIRLQATITCTEYQAILRYNIDISH